MRRGPASRVSVPPRPVLKPTVPLAVRFPRCPRCGGRIMETGWDTSPERSGPLYSCLWCGYEPPIEAMA
jgi:hypothetical protein